MNGTDLATLGEYGLLGLAVGILAWFARGAYNRETKRSDGCEMETRRLNALILTMQTDTTAALVRSAAAMEAAAGLSVKQMDLVRDLEAERDTLRRGTR